MIDVALLGAGRIGAIHGMNIHRNPGLRLVAVVDPDFAASARIAAATGARAAGLAEVLAERSIAGVVIASPTGDHLDHAAAAVAAGKAVLLEKPIDLDLDRARAAAAAFDGARLLVGFNRRFDPHFAALKAHIDAGAIGAVETVTIISHDPAPPPDAYARMSGGLFTDMTIHDFDIAHWLLGEEPTEVFAAASRLVGVDDVDGDTARTLMRTASGRLATISNTRRSGYGYDQRIEVYGAEGMAAAGNPLADTVVRVGESGGATAPLLTFFLERYAEAYRAEMDHFAAILRGECAPAVGYGDGLAALALAKAASRSAASGAVVKL